MNQEKIKEGVRLILEGIGEEIEREGLKDTPDRVARMCEELLKGMHQSPKEHLEKVFTVKDNEWIIVKDIVFHSVCEHHLLPFFGKVHIGYIPQGKVVGLSKLVRTVEVFTARLQMQERLTGQVADALVDYLNPKGVVVVVEAEHMCMTMRGVKNPGGQTISLAKRGDECVTSSLEEALLRYGKE